MPSILILSVSVLLQFSTAFLALRLIKVTGKSYAWILISVALFLMGVRRLIPLCYLIFTPAIYTADLVNELVGLVLSLMMFLGVMKIGPLLAERKRVEESIRESEEKFRAVFDGASDGILIPNLQDMKFHMANKAICGMLGYSMEEVRNLKVTDIHPENSLPYVLEQFGQQMRGESSVAKDIPVKRRDGSIFYADINSKPLTLGGQSYLLGVFRDVTERKRAEETLKENYSILHGIIDSTNALIFSVDRQYRYTSFNRGHAAVMKAIYGAEIEIGHSLLDYMTVREDAEKAQLNLDRALAGEQLVEESYSGEEPWSRLYFQVSHGPIKSEDGQVIGVSVLAQDMTERKKNEASLTLKAEEWQRTFNAINSIIWILDKDQRIVQANDAAVRYFNRPVGDFLGKHCWEVAHGTAAPIPECPIVRARKSFRREVEHLQIGDHFLEIVVDPILDADGQFVSAVHIINDITERKKAEEELRKHREHLEDLVKERTRSLQERIKELRCLYEFTRLAAKAGNDIDKVYEGMVGIIPPAMQFPELIAVRLRVEGRVYLTENFKESEWNIASDVIPAGTTAGVLEVFSSAARTEPVFLDEEQDLVRELAGRLGRMMERKRAEDELQGYRLRLEQLIQERTSQLAEETKEKKLLSSVVEQSSECIMIADQEHRIIYANQSAEVLYGTAQGGLSGTNLYDLNADPYKSGQIESGLKSGGQWNGLVEQRRKGKENFMAWGNFKILKDEGDRKPLTIVFVTDTTERVNLQKAVMEISEKEKMKLGRDLHDGLGQYLTGIGLMAKALEHRLKSSSIEAYAMALELSEEVNMALTETRRIISEISYGELEVKDLHNAFVRLCFETQKIFGIECVHECNTECRMDDQKKIIQIYRIAQEAVHNAAKYSKAKTIKVVVDYQEQEGVLEVAVIDDGVGIPKEVLEGASGRGFGFRIMEYRAQQIGGGLAISSEQGKGTTVLGRFSSL